MKNQPNKYHVTSLKDYTPSPFLIEAAHLQFTLHPKETTVETKLHIKRNPEATTQDSAVKLDGTKLQLQSIKLNQEMLAKNRYRLTANDLTILQVPDDFILETVVKIHPENNLTCTGLYLTHNNFCTQNEPHGFRTITYFIDRPDILTKFTTTITADKNSYPVLLSNGNLLTQKQLDHNQHQVVWEDPFPKSPYLFAVVAGNFAYLEDHYTTNSRRKIILRIFAEPHQLDLCHHAMFSLKQAMVWEEKTFGLEYDLDLYQIVAINDLNVGAMENKGLNVFNSELLLASPATATDSNFANITAVIAHEYFHNWTGNRVTCRDWFQIGLKEGLTTLREQLFMEDLYGEAINRINTIKTIYTRQFAEDSSPLAHPIRLKTYIEVDNFYTYTVYYKSAEVARMLITLFGRRTFQKIMQKFLAKFDGQAVTFEDFLQVAATITRTDLTQFMRWYDQHGTPLLKITDKFTKNKSYRLKVAQQHPLAPKDFYLPLALGLIQTNGSNTKTKTLSINKKQQNFTLGNFATKPLPSLLRNFSAPVKIQYSYTKEELLFLVHHDQDPVNRWEASQKLLTAVIRELYVQQQAKQPLLLPQVLHQMFEIILESKKTDPALAAEMLRLPVENQLLETLINGNIDHLHAVYEFIQFELAKSLKKPFLTCYKNNQSLKPYNLNALAIGRRDLKNVCLHYLMHLNTPEIFAIGKKQLTTSDNLTDTLASLVAMVNSSWKDREQLLEKYYQKWRTEPNLVSKWLAINASIKSPGNLKRIKKLMTLPAFNLKNPNSVFALLRTFCENNLVNFHLPSGDGYKFLAKQIIVIDKFNPQLAAALTLPLTSGHRLDSKRRKLLHQQLIKIKQLPKLSPNVHEIVTKALSSE